MFVCTLSAAPCRGRRETIMVWCLVKDCGRKMDGWCSSSLQCGESGVGVFTCRSRSQAEVPADCILQGAPGSRSRTAAEGARGRWGPLSASAGVCLQPESTGNLSHGDHIELKRPGRTSTLLVFMLLAVKKTCFYLKSSKGTDESFSQSTASCSCSTARCFLPKLEVGVCDFSLSHLLSASKSCNRGATTHGRLSSQLCIWLMHPETFQYSSPCKNVLNAIWKDI